MFCTAFCNFIGKISGIGPSHRQLGASLSGAQRNNRDVAEAISRFSNALVSTAYYSLSGVRVGAQLGSLATRYIAPAHSSSSFWQTLEVPLVQTTLQVLGLITSGLTLAEETVDFGRQARLLYILAHENPLSELQKLKDSGEFEKAFPEWFCKGLNLTGNEVLVTIKDMTDKKAVVHAIGWISCLLCVIGFAGACMPATAGLYIAIGFALWVLRWILNQGWIENEKGGFSLRHLSDPVINFLRESRVGAAFQAAVQKPQSGS
jgi:hypothetical protein